MELTLIDFDSPADVRTFAKGRFEVYRVGPMTLGRDDGTEKVMRDGELFYAS
jgi:hypothetical protein